MSKLKNFWCIFCEAYRTHVVRGNTEQATCRTCGKLAWMPTGEGD